MTTAARPHPRSLVESADRSGHQCDLIFQFFLKDRPASFECRLGAGDLGRFAGGDAFEWSRAMPLKDGPPHPAQLFCHLVAHMPDPDPESPIRAEGAEGAEGAQNSEVHRSTGRFQDITLHQALRHADWWEMRIANDATYSRPPLGFVHGHVVVRCDTGPEIYDLIDTRAKLIQAGEDDADPSNTVELFDQTSVSWIIGEPTYRQQTAKLARLLQLYPYELSMDPEGGVRLTDRTLDNWANLDERSEDHWDDTHRTGSPRNNYYSQHLAAWRYRPFEPRPLIKLMEWVSDQYGGLYPDEQDGWSFRPGRPYHLHDYGGYVPKPFSRASLPPGSAQPRFSEGVLKVRASEYDPPGSIPSFGREKLRILDVRDVGYDPDEWLGARIKGFRGWSRKRITSRGWNGWDPEHFAVQKLVAAALLTGSVFARNALQNLIETLKLPPGEGTLGIPIKAWAYSSRTFGWILQALCEVGLVLEREGDWQLARRMRDAFAERETNGLLPGYRLRRPVALTANRQASWWGDDAWISEKVWQAAVAAMGLWKGYLLDPDQKQAEVWRAIALEATDLLEQAYIPSEGMAEIYRADTEEILFLGNPPSWFGTSHWVYEPVAIARILTGDEKYDWAIEGYQALREYPGWRRYDDQRDLLWRWHPVCRAAWRHI